MNKVSACLEEAIISSQSAHPNWLLNRDVYNQIKSDCETYADIIESAECKSLQILIDNNGDCVVGFVSPFAFGLSLNDDAHFFASIQKMKSIKFHLYYDRFEDEENYHFMKFQFTYPLLFKTKV